MASTFMNLKFHSSVIFVKDINISKQFYCELLKQEIETDFGNNVSLKGGISLWQIPEWHSLNNNFYNRKAGNKAFEIYFETDDIVEVSKNISNQNSNMLHEIIEETWGQKTLRIFDPDGNLIEIGEKLEVFIRRLYATGMTLQQIAEKTGVPVNQIEKIIA
jgi:catechol 2,3-dioxygenase-like lactoylglutathione lyase family enzyme